MSLRRKIERTRRDAVEKTTLAIARWLRQRAAMEEVYSPLVKQALEAAARELRRSVLREVFDDPPTEPGEEDDLLKPGPTHAGYVRIDR